MFELAAEKFAPLMNVDREGLIAYSKKNGKPSKKRIEAASKVNKRLL